MYSITMSGFCLHISGPVIRHTVQCTVYCTNAFASTGSGGDTDYLWDSVHCMTYRNNNSLNWISYSFYTNFLYSLFLYFFICYIFYNNIFLYSLLYTHYFILVLFLYSLFLYPMFYTLIFHYLTHAADYLTHAALYT